MERKQKMITEQQLKDKITPEFIKWCCEYAKGYDYIDEYIFRYNNDSFAFFPLLLHRTVEGWNKKQEWLENSILINKSFVDIHNKKGYKINNYQPSTLTPCECVILHCLLDIFEEVE